MADNTVELNPYGSPSTLEQVHAGQTPSSPASKNGGPALYLAGGALVGVLSALPFWLPLLLHANDVLHFRNLYPWGCVLVLFGLPLGGFAYRIRSRKWTIDPSVRSRQLWLSCTTIALPLVTALSCPLTLHPLSLNRSQAILLTLFACLLAGSLAVGIFASGTRRKQWDNG